MRVADLLKDKSSTVMTVEPTLSIEALAARLRAARVGVMIVSRDGHSLDGIVSERDIAYGLAEHGVSLPGMLVEDVMTETVITCTPQDTVAAVAKVMTLRRIRHLPVKEGDAIVGVISIGDVLKSRISEIELEANVLRDIAIAVR